MSFVFSLHCCVHCAVCVLEISPSSAVAGGYSMFLPSSACLNAYAFELKPTSKIGFACSTSPTYLSLVDRPQGFGLHSLGNKHVEYDGFHIHTSLYILGEEVSPPKALHSYLAACKIDKHSALSERNSTKRNPAQTRNGLSNDCLHGEVTLV